jgi:hypothetical protein
MQIVCALDVHRRQITFKTLAPASGEGSRGSARPPASRYVSRQLGGT